MSVQISKHMYRAYVVALLGALVWLCACDSGNTDAGDLADALADRLTDALDFDDRTVINNPMPAGSDISEAPVIDGVSVGTLRLGAPMGFSITSSFEQPESVETALVAVEGSKRHIEVPGGLAEAVFALSGTLLNDPELAGKSFTLRFALRTLDGVVGMPVTLEVQILDMAPQQTDLASAFVAVTASGETYHDSGKPSGSGGGEAPQIVTLTGPAMLSRGQAFEIDVQTNFSGDVQTAIVSTPNNNAYKEVPVSLVDGRGLIQGVMATQFVEVGDILVFQWALKSGDKVGLYRNWIVSISDGDVPVDGDMDEDEDLTDTDPEPVDGDETEAEAEEEISEIESVDNDPEVIEEETDPEIIELEADPEIIEEEADPEVIELEADPEIIEEDADPDIVELEADPEIIEEEADPEIEIEEESLPPYPADYCRHAMCWLLPSDQDTCYNLSGEIACPAPGEQFYGQAGNYYNPDNVRSFSCYNENGVVETCPDTAIEHDMVKDDITGLMWQRRMDPAPAGCEAGNTAYCTAEEAIAYCDNLVYGGHDDWHLPGIAELLTLFATGSGTAGIVPFYFTDTPAEIHWSSSYYTAADQYNYVDFGETFSNRTSKTTEGAVRCVRVADETQLPVQRFTEQSDTEPVVVDTMTGLMWRSTSDGFLTWESALTTCENLSWDGFEDWRLPTLYEALTLIDTGSAATPHTELPGFISAARSSSTRPASATWSFQVNVDSNGLIQYNRKTNQSMVYCVRNAN